MHGETVKKYLYDVAKDQIRSARDTSHWNIGRPARNQPSKPILLFTAISIELYKLKKSLCLIEHHAVKAYLAVEA
jgi:hypothetical protein